MGRAIDLRSALANRFPTAELKGQRWAPFTVEVKMAIPPGLPDARK